MRSMVFRFVIIVSGIFSLFSCRELYYPDILPAPDVLTVEGLISDQPGPYYIKLSGTVIYGGDAQPGPVEGAEVIVTDDSGGNHLFTETEPGLYQSPDDLKGETMGTYTLRITTVEGDEFRSSPQTLLPGYKIDSLIAESTTRLSVYEFRDNMTLYDERGVKATLLLKDHEGLAANIRFKSDLKILFTKQTGGPLVYTFYYCWKKIPRFEGVDNINLPVGDQPGDVNRNQVAFLPDKNRAYGIFDEYYVKHKLIKVTLYSINDEAYNFYYEVNKQLASGENIFSPIHSQLPGNIYCINDESKVATGLFEASSVDYATFLLVGISRSPSVFFEPTDVYDIIPEDDCSVNQIPSFWIYR